jgi:alkane 1-monooxygenase
LLETINYIEHYGLRRRQKSSGLYERVMPWHSWNSSHIFGRMVLYELTRHSDHHYQASRPYQVLRHMEEAPQLPAGYPAMMLLSLVPPLWFKVMDKRAAAVMDAHAPEFQTLSA